MSGPVITGMGWVTVSWFNSRCGTFTSICHQPPMGHLSLAIPSWVGAMSTSQRALTPCGWGVKAGMVCLWVADKTDPTVTHRPYLSAFEV